MQFLLIGRDGTDAQALERRLAVREEHLRHGDRMRDEGRLLYAVAMLNDAGQMAGSVMIYDFPSRKDLDDWLAREPYITGGVWQDISIQECRIGPSFAGH